MGDRNESNASPGAASDPLGLIIQAEAARSGLQLRIEPDATLIADGWELRFTGDARRVQESTALYSELGFEVRTLPVQPTQLSEECGDCQLIAALHFQTIYIRRKR